MPQTSTQWRIARFDIAGRTIPTWRMFPNNRLIAILAFPIQRSRSNALRHHFGGEPLKEIKGALKVLSVTARSRNVATRPFLKVARCRQRSLGHSP